MQTEQPTLTEQFEIFFTEDQRNALNKEKIPHHVAIIPDGNRRWAKKNGFSIIRGHRQGADNLMEIVKAAKALGIKIITFYIFSTENWARDNIEVRALLWLLESYLVEQAPTMLESGVSLKTIGDISRFPSSVVKTIKNTVELTKHCQDIDMVFALNYGGRDDIRRAVQSILLDFKKENKFPVEAVTEDLISRYLDTAQWPDPELLIRTSGEQRMSNFLLWQTSYTEIYIADVLWPEFYPEHLLEAILAFQRRERRLGAA